MPWSLASGSETPSPVDQMRQIIDKHHFEVGSKTWVGVTHVNNPQSFFVRIRILDPHMSVIEQRGAPIDPLDIYPQIKILYKSRIEDKYVRGKVFFIDGTKEDMKCDIFAIDYGFFEKDIPINEVCTIGNGRDHEIPPLAVHCQLANCFPFRGEWCKDATSSLKYYVGKERALMTVREKRSDICVVELQNSCPDDLSKMMAYAGCSHYGYAENVVTRVNAPQAEKNFFIHKDLKVGDKLHVRVQSGKELSGFFVADKKDYNVYLNQRVNFTYFSDRSQPLTIDEMKVDKHVAVYMHSTCKYERGIIREIIGKEKARVQLVDWGSMVDVMLILLRPMSSRFYYYPVTAIYCAIVDQPLPASIARLLLGTEFLITVIKVGDQFKVPHQVTAKMIK